MKERRAIGFALGLSLTVLVEVFILLFAYVNSEWGNQNLNVINPVNTVIATGAMILVGIIVYIKRNTRRQK